jgi:DNA-binding CsgD family transcriptional regulator
VSEDGEAPYGLSHQEMRVLQLMTEGLADEEIAAELGVVPDSVKRRIARILRKMGTSSRTVAAVTAIKRGLFALSLFALHFHLIGPSSTEASNGKSSARSHFKPRA